MKKTITLLYLLISFISYTQTHELADEYWNKAEIAREKEDWENAAILFEKSAEAEKKSPNPRQKDLSFELSRAASSYTNVEEYKKAELLYSEALKTAEKALGKEHSEYGTLLNYLANLYFIIEQYQKALPLYLEAIENAKKNTGKVLSIYGTRVNNLANTYKKIKQYEDALPLYIEVLEITEKELGKEHSDYSICLNNLAELYYKMQKYQKALPLYIELQEITEKKFGIEHSKYWIGLNNLARLYEDLGEYNEAISLNLKALKSIEKTLGKNHSEYGVYLYDLAKSYKKLGLFKKTLTSQLKALEITKKTLGKEHFEYSFGLMKLADTYYFLGQYDKSLALYKEATESAKKTLGKEHPVNGVILTFMSDIYYNIGDNNKAFALQMEALSYNKDYINQNNNYNSIILLVKAASLALDMGNYNKAFQLCQQSLEIIKKTLGIKHSYYGAALKVLGDLYLELKKYKEALSLYQKSAQIIKDAVGINHIDYGYKLIDLSKFYLSIKQFDKAILLYKKSIEIIENNLGSENPDYGYHLKQIGRFHLSKGDYNQSITYFLEANSNTLNYVKQSFTFLTQKEKQNFIQNNVGENLNIISNFNYSTKNYSNPIKSQALNNILISKGLLLNYSKNILTLLEGLNNKDINDKILEFREKNTYINQQIQLPITERKVDFKSKKENLETLERELVELYSKHFNEEINYIKNWKNTKLKTNDIAIEFTHFYHYNKKWTDSTMYVAYLYKKDWKTPKVVNLFEEKQLKKYFSISNNPNTLYKTRGTITKSSKAQLAVVDSIYKLVWKPLEKYIDSSSTIYFSPDGLLHKVPFAALPNEKNKLIGEVYNIQQMGNTADVGTNSKQPNLKDVLLIGGVQYDYKIDATKQKKKYTYSVLESKELLGDTINRSISRNGFGYLKGTEKEIKDISNLLGATKQLSGYKATETAFKELSGNSPSILHIATHGFFFKKPKKKPKNNQLLGQQNSYKHNKNPLLRSGLLLANANYAWQNGNNPYEEDDGILTALEISNLDLKNTDIVILSACETGLGDIEGSEGVYGLQRAFKMAGVKTIIMSLWSVPDAETAEFMNLFYTNWKQLNNPKKAFKATQKTMMQKYRKQPEKWAAFVYFE